MKLYPSNPTEPRKAGDDADSALIEAYEALHEGDIQTARGLSQSSLLAAKAHANQSLEAQALLCLAHCDQATWRLRRASDTSRRAALMFQRLGETRHEAVALNTLANCSMLLGRNDEAVESALLSVRLCETNIASVETVLAHNCLGTAYGWSGNFQKARTSLEAAVQLASRCVPMLSPYEPTLNLVWLEASRLVDERYRTGAMSDLGRMGSLIDECRRLSRSDDRPPLHPGMQSMHKTSSAVMKSLLSAWMGEADHAKAYADQALGSLAGTLTWLDSLVRWAIAEEAWAREDWTSAEAALTEMKALALTVEHEQLACVAHLLLAQVFEIQRKTGPAQAEHRALRTRERRMAGESLSSREAVVAWQIDARRSETQLEQALEASRQFKQWSLEDALTGIANRRCFELALADKLASSNTESRPMAVAMIDVNRFKTINDTFSHQTGDEVLTALAKVLTGSIRDNDLAARLAGDEFVVLFGDADEAVALEICDRIHQSLAAFDWSAIAPNLSVSVTIGVSPAIAGDTVESLVHRSDKSMYKAKPGWVSTNFH